MTINENIKIDWTLKVVYTTKEVKRQVENR